MARKHLAVRISDLTVSHACLQLLPGSGRSSRLVELTIIPFAATAQSLGLGMPATSCTPSANLQFVDESMAAASSVATAAIAFSAHGTIPDAFIRRLNTAAVGGIYTFRFENGINIPTLGLVLWNITAAQASDVNITIDE